MNIIKYEKNICKLQHKQAHYIMSETEKYGNFRHKKYENE